MFKTIQGRMIGIFLGFIALMASGVAASYVILERQADDGLIVNLAGRQRMLTQKMAKESAQLVNAASTQNAGHVKQEADGLAQTIRVFEATLLALRDGGSAPLNLEMTRMRQAPAAATPEIRSVLEAVFEQWEPFKRHLNEIISSAGTSTRDVEAVAKSNGELLAAMNKAVDLMQADQETKVRHLYVVQSLALACGLLLVALGAWLARTTIARPIAELAEAARMMSTGNLNVEFKLKGTQEVQELGASFDRMRASMVAAFGGAGGVKGIADDDL
jgi:nitrate/nitrite-specific signal transduction histidine kinase